MVKLRQQGVKRNLLRIFKLRSHAFHRTQDHLTRSTAFFHPFPELLHLNEYQGRAVSQLFSCLYLLIAIQRQVLILLDLLKTLDSLPHVEIQKADHIHRGIVIIPFVLLKRLQLMFFLYRRLVLNRVCRIIDRPFIEIVLAPILNLYKIPDSVLILAVDIKDSFAILHQHPLVLSVLIFKFHNVSSRKDTVQQSDQQFLIPFRPKQKLKAGITHRINISVLNTVLVYPDLSFKHDAFFRQLSFILFVHDVVI